MPAAPELEAAHVWGTSSTGARGGGGRGGVSAVSHLEARATASAVGLLVFDASCPFEAAILRTRVEGRVIAVAGKEGVLSSTVTSLLCSPISSAPHWFFFFSLTSTSYFLRSLSRSHVFLSLVHTQTTTTTTIHRHIKGHLRAVPCHDKWSPTARRLLAALSCVDPLPPGATLIPRGGVLREYTSGAAAF